ncbi:MAG: GPR endopeptidase, partial [Clostridiaceae bacterium]|nr:GPR endopeptidase [Clostridiaceae bacterium]
MENIKRSIRTDMADESRVVGAGAQARENYGGFGEGIQVEKDGDQEVFITRVHVNTPEGEQKVGKPIGSYITMDIPGI